MRNYCTFLSIGRGGWEGGGIYGYFIEQRMISVMLDENCNQKSFFCKTTKVLALFDNYPKVLVYTVHVHVSLSKFDTDDVSLQNNSGRKSYMYSNYTK